LPQQIREDRRKAIAIATARADVVVESNRLCALTDLGRTYRRAEMIDQAVATFRDNLENAKSKIDFESDIRGYWYEWGVCEGIAGNTPEHRAADAWIQGLSISDYLPVPITLGNGKLVCAGLGVAFGKLAHVGADSSYAHALRAVAYIGRLTNPDRKTAGYFDRSDEEAEKLKTPRPRDVHEAIAWLTAAVAQAGRELQDSFLKSLIEPDRVSFNMFENILSPNSTPTERTLTFVKTTEPSVATNSGAELLKRFLPLEDPIHVGVERVIKEAWNAVPPGTAPQERFFLAIKKAKQSISRLSPQIKRQVGAHFETKGWEPLKTREPKP
jgi:hypothetical protein